MRKHILLIRILVAVSLLVLPQLDAAPRSGGGKPSGGGGRSVQRSPSMSRTTASRPQNRPQQLNRVQQPNHAQTLPHRSSISRPQSKPNIPQQARPSVPQRSADRLPIQGGGKNIPQNLSGKGSLPQTGTRPSPTGVGKRGDRQNIANKVRNNVGSDRPDRGNWFKNDFWINHGYYPPYFHHNNNLWAWTTAAGIGGWLAWNSAPIYYDYDDSDGGYDSTETESPFDYVDQAQVIDTAAAQPPGDDWMPLGVFAISKEGESVAAPNIYLQLAINKEGLISGYHYNATTVEGYEIEGTVDPNTQTVIIKAVNNPDSPIIETGLYNLTETEAPIRVHFVDGRTMNMLLIRLDDPNDQP